jgi:hypothetical protein
MADNRSRISIILVALPSLLLAGLVLAMGSVYASLGDFFPEPVASSPARVHAPTSSSTEMAMSEAPTQAGAGELRHSCDSATRLRMNCEISVDIYDSTRPIRLSYGRLRIRAILRPRGNNQVRDVLITVGRGGTRPQRIAVSAAESDGLTFSVGRLDRAGTPYIMVRSFTAGFHCCFGVNLIIPEGPDRGAVELGYFDANAFDGFEGPPADIDGDGRTDFVIRDDRFYYQFAPYGGTDQPPRIWNIRHGRAIEVSAAGRYRPVFQRDMAGRRAYCLRSRAVPFDVLLACPAYVATAARLGQFRGAWRDMLSVYDHSRDDAAVGERFPHHLRRFLRANGYLPA